jgi:hypothetical protein
MWCEGVDWIHLAENRVQCGAVVNTVMNLLSPEKATISVSRRTLLGGVR